MNDGAANVFDRIVIDLRRTMESACIGSRHPQRAEGLRAGNTVRQHAFSTLKTSYCIVGLGAEPSIDKKFFTMLGKRSLKLTYPDASRPFSQYCHLVPL